MFLKAGEERQIMFYRAQEKRDELEEKQRVAATMLIPALTILFMFWIHTRS